MADYIFTRENLRTFQTKSSNWSGTYLGSLVNNSSTTAYFAIEGARYYISESGGFVGHKYKDVFNSASITSLTNGSLVSGSTNCGIIVNPNSTSAFAFTITGTIVKEQLLVSAPNVHVISGSTNSFYGVEFTATGT